MTRPSPTARRLLRAIESATVLIFIVALLGALLAGALGGAVYGLSKLLHHLASQ